MSRNLTKEYKRLHGGAEPIYQALLDAGIVEVGDYPYRVTIDIAANMAVQVTIYRYADDRVLDAVRTIGAATKAAG